MISNGCVIERRSVRVQRNCRETDPGLFGEDFDAAIPNYRIRGNGFWLMEFREWILGRERAAGNPSM